MSESADSFCSTRRWLQGSQSLESVPCPRDCRRAEELAKRIVLVDASPSFDEERYYVVDRMLSGEFKQMQTNERNAPRQLMGQRDHA